jgi:hypothetical protein
MTQLAIDVLFRSIGENMIDGNDIFTAQDSLQECDGAESSLTIASHFLSPSFRDSVASRAPSRAATPGLVRPPTAALSYIDSPITQHIAKLASTFSPECAPSQKSVRLVTEGDSTTRPNER